MLWKMDAKTFAQEKHFHIIEKYFHFMEKYD